tara:strand:- start:2537 stop:4384 length:1848 start_codon:yes stop_codon:yes gene_type:complete
MANSSAGLGGMMIRNLRRPTDYAKAVMTQDELLRIAVSNDANIARARRDIRLGVPPPVPERNLKTAEELMLDVGKQESDVLRNILDLGFTYDESSTIVARLSQDQMFKLNRTYPALKKEFENRYDVKLITPSFFMDYISKYLEELDASRGVSSAYGLGYIQDKFDELIDTTNELKAVIPTKNQMKGLRQIINQRFNELPAIIIEPIMARVDILDDLLPDGRVYQMLDQIQREDQAHAYKLNQELQNALQGLPSRDQVERTLMDLEDRRIGDADGLKRIEDIVNDMDATQTQQLSNIIALINQTNAQISSINFVDGDVVSSMLIDLGGDNVGFGLLGDNKTIVQITSTGDLIKMSKPKLDEINRIVKAQGFPDPKLTMKGMKQSIQMNNQAQLTEQINRGEYSSAESAFEATTGEDLSVDYRNPISSSKPSGTLKSFGFTKSGTGVAPRVKLPKTKVQGGIHQDKKPPYRQLGKYVIHHKQLMDNDMLNVKYKSLGRIPQFKPIPISDSFKEYIVDVLDSGKHNDKNYKHIPVEERKIWEKVVSGAGLGDVLKIKKTITDGDKEDMERFEMLKGQYISGNNSPSVIRELRRFVVRFLSEGKLKRNQALDLLLELSV